MTLVPLLRITAPTLEVIVSYFPSDIGRLTPCGSPAAAAHRRSESASSSRRRQVQPLFGPRRAGALDLHRYYHFESSRLFQSGNRPSISTRRMIRAVILAASTATSAAGFFP